MKRRNFALADDESQPVMVPRSNKPLVAILPERVQRLREHLMRQLSNLRKAKPEFAVTGHMR
jgi:hypothetical protein